jgi:hypothetical protein
MFDRWCILKLAILAPARLRAKLLTHCYPESQEIFNPSIRVHVFLLLIGFFLGGEGILGWNSGPHTLPGRRSTH